MTRTLSVAALATLALLTGCAADSSTDGVDGSKGVSVTSTETADEPDMSTVEPSEEPSEDLIKAVTIKSCKIGEYGVEIEGTITNPSKEVSDMMATIEITNPAGDRIDEAGVIESAVKPGQKVNYEASGMELAEDLDTKKITCSVLSVDRYPTS